MPIGDDLLPEDLRGARRRRLSSDMPNIPNVKAMQTNQACNIDEISKGSVVPYQAPGAPPGTPPTSEAGMLAEHLKEMNAILAINNELIAKIEKYLTYKSPTDTWYELRFQTTVATPNQPITPDTTADAITVPPTPGYDFIEVSNQLKGRNAQKLYIVNDGPDNLFVITSSDGRTFSPEFLMINGETRIIGDVYEFRVRSPNTGLIPSRYTSIRATEREIYPPYTTQITNTFPIQGSSNGPNFIARNIAVGIVDNPLPDITIPNGFAVIIRANVNNPAGSQVYISRTDATIVADRITLSVGDVVSLYITNTNLIHFVGSGPGLTIDILAEQL